MPTKEKMISIDEFSAVYRQGINPEQVVIISGGGSGHEPTFAGFIGFGGIDGCALGEVFYLSIARSNYRCS